ncbi:MAG: nitroreductase family protein [Bacteroidales bacterium]|nr:nitroreductase family protein [Bacteroidales bacterium]
MKKLNLLVIMAILTFSNGISQDIILPEPDREGGIPVMLALNLRHSSREFSPEKLPLQVMSDLLWAACGTTRGSYRTAPSARNFQEISAYVVTEEAVYLYHEKDHYLERLVDGDYREFTGTQPFVKDAPLTIVLVADHSRMGNTTGAARTAYAWADASYISQNIYLYCASADLNTGVRALVDREVLAEKMQLGEGYEIVFAQCVGYPVK